MAAAITAAADGRTPDAARLDSGAAGVFGRGCRDIAVATPLMVCCGGTGTVVSTSGLCGTSIVSLSLSVLGVWNDLVRTVLGALTIPLALAAAVVVVGGGGVAFSTADPFVAGKARIFDSGSLALICTPFGCIGEVDASVSVALTARGPFGVVPAASVSAAATPCCRDASALSPLCCR